MKIKYSPIKWNKYAKIEANENTEIEIKDNNSITIDDELFEFDIESITFPDIHEQTNGLMLEAHRTDDELFITVRRFYTENCEWDTGDYQ